MPRIRIALIWLGVSTLPSPVLGTALAGMIILRRFPVIVLPVITGVLLAPSK